MGLGCDFVSDTPRPLQARCRPLQARGRGRLAARVAEALARLLMGQRSALSTGRATPDHAGLRGSKMSNPSVSATVENGSVWRPSARPGAMPPDRAPHE